MILTICSSSTSESAYHKLASASCTSYRHGEQWLLSRLLAVPYREDGRLIDLLESDDRRRQQRVLGNLEGVQSDRLKLGSCESLSFAASYITSTQHQPWSHFTVFTVLSPLASELNHDAGSCFR